MAKPIVHGTAGYRRGCKCETCRGAHAKEERARRLARKATTAQGDKAPKVEPPLPPLQSVPASDILKHAKAGPIEKALAGDLKKLVGEPPWKATLSEIALMDARVLDNAAALDRLDLISPLQLRLFEAMGKLRAVAGSDLGIAAGAKAMLDGISQPQ